MGQYSIRIDGLGSHHNSGAPGDADQLARELVAQLLAKGHAVNAAVFVGGAGKESLFSADEIRRRDDAAKATVAELKAQQKQENELLLAVLCAVWQSATDEELSPRIVEKLPVLAPLLDRASGEGIAPAAVFTREVAAFVAEAKAQGVRPDAPLFAKFIAQGEG